MKVDFTLDVPNSAPDAMELIRTINARVRVAALETGLTVVMSRLSTDEYHEKITAAITAVGA